jgi:hypothetical protein
LSGGGQLLAPLISAQAQSAPMIEDMIRRGFGGLFGQDIRTESERIQGMLSQADTATPEGQQALIAALRNQGYGAQAAQLQQQLIERAEQAKGTAFTQDIQSRQIAATEGNLELNREQQEAALLEARNERNRLQQEKEANRDSSLELINGAKGLNPADAATLRSMVRRNPAITLSQVQTAITNFGGFPDDEGSASSNLQFRTGEVVGEENRGLQSFILNPDTGAITRTIQNPDGTMTEEMLPSSKVRFISSTRDASAPSLEGGIESATTPLQKPLFEVVGSAIGAGNYITGLYNESPLADLFGTNEEVAEAQARFAGFENKILTLYNRRSRPSNWSEQRLIRLLPKIGSPLESEGSAQAKLVDLKNTIQDQYDYEIQQYQATSGNPAQQQEHYATIQDLGRLLEDFGPLPVDGDTLPVPTTRAEIEALPSGTQFWLDGKVVTRE